MGRTKKGQEVHKELIEYAATTLKEDGYSVKFEVIIGNKKRIDIIAYKENEKIGVECMVYGYEPIMLQRIKDCEEYFDKIIFFVGAKSKRNLTVPPPHEIIHVEHIGEFHLIRVSGKTYHELVKACALLQLLEERSVSLDETIARSLSELPKIDLKGEISKSPEK